MNILIQDIMLVLAVSIDAFLAAFSLGSEKIRIPPLSAAVISLICTAVLSCSILVSSLIGSALPEKYCLAFGGAILIIMGTVSLFQNMLKSALRKRQGRGGISFHFFSFDFVISVYLDETQADSDRSKRLSAKEAVTLALVLSPDSLASGLGAGLGGSGLATIATAGIISGLAAVALGNILGRKVSHHKPSISWLSGITLIILGIFKYLP